MTIREQLNRLPKPYRSLALKRADKEHINCESDSVCDAIEQAFLWHVTPEGDDFWNSVRLWARQYIDNAMHKLPPIPEE